MSSFWTACLLTDGGADDDEEERTTTRRRKRAFGMPSEEGQAIPFLISSYITAREGVGSTRQCWLTSGA